MSADIEEWPPPKDAIAFESLCLDLWKEIWTDPSAQKNGRSGQAQAGVDVFSQRDGLRAGVQCKQKDGLLWKKVTETELRNEVAAAQSFQPALKTFVLATTGRRDAHLQKCARLLSEEQKGKGLFGVEIWAWEDIWHELYQRKDLFDRISPIYWPKLAVNKTVPIGPWKTIVVAVLIVALVFLALFLREHNQSASSIKAEPEYIEGTLFTQKRLSEIFPFGYAVFYFGQNRILRNEIFKNGLMDWKLDVDNVSIDPIFFSGKVTWTIPNENTKTDGLDVQIKIIGGGFTIQAPLKQGYARRLGFILGNKPILHVMTLSDNQRTPVFAIGFRIPAEGEEYPPNPPYIVIQP